MVQKNKKKFVKFACAQVMYYYSKNIMARTLYIYSNDEQEMYVIHVYIIMAKD
jgi:hypothetical protein